MIRKIACILTLSILLLACIPAYATAPGGGGWVECVRQCDRAYASCYSNCDIFDDACWNYCASIYITCLLSCGVTPDSIPDSAM